MSHNINSIRKHSSNLVSSVCALVLLVIALPGSAPAMDTDSNNAVATVRVFITDGYFDLSEGIAAAVLEGISPVTATVRLDEAATEPVAVTIYTGAAFPNFPPIPEPGEDYLPLDQRVTFQPGETEKDIAITVLNDSEIESNEAFVVKLKEPTGAVIGNTSRAGQFPYIEIIDDDSYTEDPELRMSVRSFSEADGTVPVSLFLSRPTTKPVSALIFTRSGSAESGVDFWGFSQSIRIEPGDLSATVDLTIIDDQFEESLKYLQLIAVNATNAKLPSDNVIATISIEDNDDGTREQWIIDISDVTVTETDGKVDVTLGLNRPAPDTGVLVVAFDQRNGSTASAGEDYWGFSDSIGFAPGETETTFSVDILDDDVVEGPEQLILQLGVPLFARLARYPLTATMTIIDDDSK